MQRTKKFIVLLFLIFMFRPFQVMANAQEIIHTVKPGDTLWKLSQYDGVSMKDIASANGITLNSIIYVNQKLKIPFPQPIVKYTEYTVQKGDTAWNVSLKFGISMSELLSVNKLTEQSVLNIGQKLTIPVHIVPKVPVVGPKYGEYLDWWTQAQYVFPIGAIAKVIDFDTGKSFYIKRSFGASHADNEPLTAQDAKAMYEIWGNKWSWEPRAVIVEVNGRRIAASATNMPHSIETIGAENKFDGHFDIHFLNSRTHAADKINPLHQAMVKKAAGITY